MCSHLKAADGAWLPRLAVRVWIEASGRGRFAAMFGPHAVLIPVPGSAPASQPVWVGERLAWCLKEAGLAAAVWPVLTRRYPVRKSAFAPAGERPSVLEHYASFVVDRAACERAAIVWGSLPRAGVGTRPQLTLVDDVITRGRTILAAARRLRDAFPDAEIHAFALLRTLGRRESFERLLDPCEGEVRWVSGDARRIP